MAAPTVQARYPPSIDRPGTRRDDVVIPSISIAEPCTREQWLSMKDLPPMSSLPRVLVPNPKAVLRPPIMHYGWYANEEALLKHARNTRVGLTLPGTVSMLEIFLRIATGQRVEDVRHEDDDDRYDDRPQNLSKLQKIAMMQLALTDIVRTLDPSWPRGALMIMDTFTSDERFVVSLYTNHALEKAPSPEQIEALRVRLGESEPPKWYLDRTVWGWAPEGWPRVPASGPAGPSTLLPNNASDNTSTD
ncbi:hypothetical protein BKA93DRAFT_773595 [Sparassis latifolia]